MMVRENIVVRCSQINLDDYNLKQVHWIDEVLIPHIKQCQSEALWVATGDVTISPEARFNV